MDGSLPTRSLERKDGWTPELDQILLDIVIKGLSEGQTQVACFAKAAEKIGKSNSACAFRFNTTIRKQASEAIERAKLAGKSKKEIVKEEAVQEDIIEEKDYYYNKNNDLITTNLQVQAAEKSESTNANETKKSSEFEVIETFQAMSEANKLYQDLGQPSLEKVIEMLQKIQQHNGLALENTYRRKIDELQRLLGDALEQVDQIKMQLQVALDELHEIQQ